MISYLWRWFVTKDSVAPTATKEDYEQQSPSIPANKPLTGETSAVLAIPESHPPKSENETLFDIAPTRPSCPARAEWKPRLVAPPRLTKSSRKQLSDSKTTAALMALRSKPQAKGYSSLKTPRRIDKSAKNSLIRKAGFKTIGFGRSKPPQPKRNGELVRVTQLLESLLESREYNRPGRNILRHTRVHRKPPTQLVSPPSSDGQVSSHQSPEPVATQAVQPGNTTSEYLITPAGVTKLRTILKMVIHLPGDKTKNRLAKLDTGSKVNLISQDVAEDLPIQMEPYPEDAEGVAPLGEPIRPLGTLTFDWHVMARQKTYTSTFLVLDPVSSRMFDALLGAETIEQIGFYQTNDHIWFTTGTWEKPGL